jgi:glucokinase
MLKPFCIAIDIGGTTTSFGFVTDDGKVVFKDEVATGTSPDPKVLVNIIADKCNEQLGKFSKEYELKGIGIGAPNGNFFKGTVEFAPNLKWKGIIPLADLFKKTFGVPAVLTNDANAAALGELYFGAAKNMKDFIFITLGTGLGSGIIANGQLVYGHHGTAGELGHTIIIQHGRLCGCGRKGCLEQYCSATGIVKTYLEILRNENCALPADTSKVDAKYIYDKAMGGDEAAFYAFNYTGELLGFALANSVAYTDPEAIFLFGGLTQADELLFNPTQISFENNLMSIYKNKIKLLPSGLPQNDAALLGAASLIWDALKSKNYTSHK